MVQCRKSKNCKCRQRKCSNCNWCVRCCKCVRIPSKQSNRGGRPKKRIEDNTNNRIEDNTNAARGPIVMYQ